MSEGHKAFFFSDGGMEEGARLEISGFAWAWSLLCEDKYL